MKLLYAYLRNYTSLVVLALVLATINQVLSLLDPLIFRHVIDQYATRFQEYTTAEFFKGVSLLLGAAVGVAFVSRVAKNFQDDCGDSRSASGAAPTNPSLWRSERIHAHAR